MARKHLEGSALELAHRLRSAMNDCRPLDKALVLEIATLNPGKRHAIVSIARASTATGEHPRLCYSDDVDEKEVRNRFAWQANRFMTAIQDGSYYAKAKLLWTWWELSRDWLRRLVDGRTISAFVPMRHPNASMEFVKPHELGLLSVHNFRDAAGKAVTKLALRPVSYSVYDYEDEAFCIGEFGKPWVAEVWGTFPRGCSNSAVSASDSHNQLGQLALALCLKLFTTEPSDVLATPEAAAVFPVDAYRPDMTPSKSLSAFVDNSFHSWCAAGRPEQWPGMPAIVNFVAMKRGVTLSETVDSEVWNRVCYSVFMGMYSEDVRNGYVRASVHDLPAEVLKNVNDFYLDATGLGVTNPQIVPHDGFNAEWSWNLNWAE